jgi:hypothetical protein
MGENMLQDSDSALYRAKQDNIIDPGKRKEVFDFHYLALKAVLTHHWQELINSQVVERSVTVDNLFYKRGRNAAFQGKGLFGRQCFAGF